MNSKTVYSTVLFIVIFITTLSCKKEPVEPETVVKEEQTEEIIDPFYSILTEDSSLDDYWDVFVADAIRSGKPDPGSGKVISVFFGTEPDFASGVTSDHAGRAFNICDDDTVSFEIIKSFWEDFPIMWRSVLPGNTPLEEFIRDKENFFKRDWEGIRYFNCEGQ
jgi:hypothetical protein